MSSMFHYSFCKYKYMKKVQLFFVTRAVLTYTYTAVTIARWLLHYWHRVIGCQNKLITSNCCCIKTVVKLHTCTHCTRYTNHENTILCFPQNGLIPNVSVNIILIISAHRRRFQINSVFGLTLQYHNFVVISQSTKYLYIIASRCFLCTTIHKQFRVIVGLP